MKLSQNPDKRKRRKHLLPPPAVFFPLWLYCLGATPHTPHVLLHLRTRNHNLVSAPHTFQAEVRADPQYLPLRGTAGVLFFHFQNVSDLNVHISLHNCAHDMASPLFILHTQNHHASNIHL